MRFLTGRWYIAFGTAKQYLVDVLPVQVPPLECFCLLQDVALH